MKKKNQKPIEVDSSLRYRCPKPDCGKDHWLSLKETQTKNFKVVCYCGEVFRPQRIKKIKIVYYKPSYSPQKQETQISESIEEPKNSIPDLAPKISDRLLELCSRTFMNYGFTKKEADDLLRQSYILHPTENAFELVNYTLKMIGSTDDTNS